MGIVAMSATIGSLGDEIGHEVARARGYEFADREIITKAAERFGESPIDLTHVTEEKPTLWERFRDSERRYLAAVEAIVFEMAARDDVVLAGRGATVLLGKIPHVLRVRVSAPEALRAQRVEQRQGLTREAAVDLVRQVDHERGARIKFLYHVDWDDPLLYDLVLNTERMTVERGARIVQETLADPRFTPSPDGRRRLSDMSITSQAKAALLESPLTRTLQVFPDCTNGHITITGLVDREDQRQAAQEVVTAIPGVTGVLNEIAVRPISTTTGGM